MALNFEQAFGSSNGAARGNGAAEQRPQTQIWLNVGFETPDGRFINLPVGIPIDTTEPLKIQGQNVEWNQFQSARNTLLDMLQKAGAAMEKGGEETLTGLTVKLKRVAAPAEATPADHNPLLAGMQIGFVQASAPEQAPKAGK